MKEFKGKKLLVLGGIALACDIVKHAQEMGAYVIVADYYKDSPAKRIADKAVLIDALDVDALVDFCRNEKVDGVTTGFVDILLEPCMKVCKRLGLPYYVTPKMLSMSTNKIDFKNTCNQYGVPVPQTYFVGNKIPEGLYSAIKYPVFVKPLDASGSRGAAVCGTEKELDIHLENAIQYSPSKTVVIEEYLIGREFLLNYIGVNGEYRLISMFDRYLCDDRGSAINYSNLAISPSKSIDIYLNKINEKVTSMFRSLGFMDGLFFLQGYADGDKITFFEMGCRLGGSYYHLEKKCANIDPVDMTIRYAFTGKMTNEIHKISADVAKYDKTAVCVNYLLQVRPSIIKSIEGIDEVSRLHSCVKIEQFHYVGESFSIGKAVDFPVMSFYLVEDDIEQAKKDVEYMNSIIDVKNTDDESILMKKYSLDSYN